MGWFEDLFIEEAKPALKRHSGGTGSGEEDKTYILVDEEGNEIPAVLTDEEVDLTATANDIREGVVAVTDDGVITGEKEIPSYHTYDSYRVIAKGSRITIPHKNYDYTKLQAIVCEYNTSLGNSVSAIKVSVYDNLYDVGSTIPLSAIAKDHVNGRIDFGVTNDSDKNCILRYIMYKEIY